MRWKPISSGGAARISAMRSGSGSAPWMARRFSGPLAFDAERNVLLGVSAYVMDDKNRLLERIEASEAELRMGYWRFLQARVVSLDVEPGQYDSYLLGQQFDPDEVRSALGPGQAVSFWSLPEIVSRLELAGSTQRGIA